MGLESGDLSVDQVSLSSYIQSHGHREIQPNLGDGWTPEPNDERPWICVEFLRVANVMGMILTGMVSIYNVLHVGF